MCPDCMRPYMSCECEALDWIAEDEEDIEDNNDPSEM